jgi:hypothetical protein
MKIFYFILVATLLITCRQLDSNKEMPTYNPFDEQFNVWVPALKMNNCELHSAQCGYWNLENTKHRLRTYYQYFDENPNKIVAKGFNYIIDTLPLPQNLKGTFSGREAGSFLEIPFDEIALNKELSRFNYQIIEVKEWEILISNENRADTVSLDYVTYGVNTDSTFVREINYFKTPENPIPSLFIPKDASNS